MRPSFLLLAGGLVAGCASGLASMEDPSIEPPARSDELLPIHVDTLAHEVAEVRRLPLEEPIHAQAVGAAEFGHARFHMRIDAAHADETWTAALFSPPGTAVRDLERRVMAEQVLGFYDPEHKRLFLRGGAGDGRRILPESKDDVFVLAHEIEHALQDQHFGLTGRKPAGDDAALAFGALVEGDASFTATAVQLQREPGTDHWVSRMLAANRGVPLTDLMDRHGVKTRELGAAPELLQRSTIFPYREGFLFVADLYRAGGLPLIDRAFADPPRSTEQVLHPERYLAGDWPVPVPAPAAPEGWTVRSTTSLGELATGVLLGQCIAREAGAAHARGWGGDAFAVLDDGKAHGAILWSTLWDDEDAARRFEADALGRGECLRGKDTGATGKDVAVRRSGRRVVYAQGLGPELDAAQASALLAVPVDVPAPRPPFGVVTLPPLLDPEDSFLHKGRFENGAWVSEPLGVRMVVPEDFKPQPGSTAEAAMTHTGDASASFAMLMTSPGKETDLLFVRRYLAGVRATPWMKDKTLAYVAEEPLEVDGGQGVSRTWRTASGQHIQLVFVPACDGHATVALTLSWAGVNGKLAAEDWVKHVKLPAARSLACVFLGKTTN